MKKILLCCLIVSLILSICHFNFDQESVIMSANTTRIDVPTLVIDAGHGGQDCGTIANDGTYESNINLAISHKLKEFLVSFGFNVVMTRT